MANDDNGFHDNNNNNNNNNINNNKVINKGTQEREIGNQNSLKCSR
jgi:hypothetical protein